MSKDALNYKVVLRDPGELKDRPGNARIHNRKQRRAIANSINRFGFTNPVLIDAHDVIIAGHARNEVARELGLRAVPTICLSHLTMAELNAYVIADNRTAELATWDKELLSISIASIRDADPSFDISITGFSIDEIELLDDAATSKKSKADEPIPEPPTEPISRLGDLWEIGGVHRLLCGDSTQRASYETLLGRSEKADLIVTDPPFNCRIDGNVSGLGSKKHGEFVMASGEMSPAEFRRFLANFMGAAAERSRSGSVHYVFCDWRIVRDVIDVGEGIYDELLNIAVWNKTNAGMGSFLRSQHELVTIFRKGQRPHTNKVKLGANGRNRSNVWSYPGANSFSANRDQDLADHPTVKPKVMIADAIMDASSRDDIVLDPFGGSGTTLLACHMVSRQARLIELDPRYVDVILRRSIAAGLDAKLGGQPFAEIATERTGGGQ